MSNIMRISGMATGMDTESMIKQLMDAEKIRLNKYNQQKQIKKWTQEAYNNINKDIANFILDTKKELGVGFGGSISSASWMKKATSSDTNVFDATATSSAVSGTHSIEVRQIASNVNKASLSEIDDPNVDLSGKVVKFKTSSGTEITIDGFSNINELVNKINEHSDELKIKASYDSNFKRFFLSTTEGGEENIIQISEDNGNIFTGASSILKTDLTLNEQYKGTNGEVVFDGAVITTTKNQFTINGINIDLKSADAGTVHTIKVDTDVDGVYDKIKGFIDKYNELIDKLNKKISEKRYRDYQPLTDEQKKAMDEDTVKLWEEKAKSGLLRNDEHITRILSNTRSGLYEPVYSDYDAGDSGKLSGFSFLTEIGITTGTYQEKGKLKIDETKLKDAIREDVDGVINLLFNTSDVTESEAKSDPDKAKERRAETGLINRLYDDLISGMKSIIDKSGTGDNASLYRQVKSTILIDFVTKSGSISLLDKDVINIEKQISRENDRLNRVENRYWRQFTALEKAMSKMNSQSSWLMSQMGMGM
ncbi:flagellar filament capping protein FliD [Tepidibacter thalassicus]|uniref:Flagellar hook-associated protein 2 n=1 Tax=Tepidibacter thalassicus DSM 15285 TaxID=1123350 RepID=A0A1M5R3I3_9FIRM|nr:flagellar filament capping protein FliD [Tepidibacter thalassicus]SHH20892.1 flagellar hook-associated protein 2 [Tepidibacter thalassicus DSM 15285]